MEKEKYAFLVLVDEPLTAQEACDCAFTLFEAVEREDCCCEVKYYLHSDVLEKLLEE